MLEAQRREINQIDTQLTALFERRLAIAKEIASQKYHQQLPLTDVNREHQVIKQQCAQLKDVQLAPYLTDWYRSTMLLTKQYQAHVIQKLRDHTSIK